LLVVAGDGARRDECTHSLLQESDSEPEIKSFVLGGGI
jgi:hypothetical protein